MNDQFVTYDIAKKLKELGFNEPCAGWMAPDGFLSVWIREVTNDKCAEEHCAAPLWQQVIDWLLKEHNIDIVRVANSKFHYHVYDAKKQQYYRSGDTLEKAREEAVLKALKLITKK